MHPTEQDRRDEQPKQEPTEAAKPPHTTPPRVLRAGFRVGDRTSEAPVDVARVDAAKVEPAASSSEA